MLSVDAFVTKVSIQFIDLFETANDQPLQVKLRRDARVEIDVKRVVMCLERTRGGAGCQRRQHWCFDFDITVLVEKTPNLTYDFRAQLEYLSRRQSIFVTFQFQTTGD